MFGLWNKDRGAKVQDTVVFKGVVLSLFDPTPFCEAPVKPFFGDAIFRHRE